MSKKWYGSLNNRLEENRMYCDKIEVGTGATEYFYSDSHAYEVVKVIDQKHVFIREMKAIRIDNNGMSDCQNYRYESKPEQKPTELVYRYGGWYKLYRYTKENVKEQADLMFYHHKITNTWKSAYEYCLFMSNLNDKDIERLEQGKEVKKYSKSNISFGVMQEYFDYSF